GGRRWPHGRRAGRSGVAPRVRSPAWQVAPATGSGKDRSCRQGRPGPGPGARTLVGASPDGSGKGNEEADREDAPIDDSLDQRHDPRLRFDGVIDGFGPEGGRVLHGKDSLEAMRLE